MENKIRKELHGKTFAYDTAFFCFKEELEKLFGCPLEDLHTQLGVFERVNLQTCQKTLAHRVFYANFEQRIGYIYRNLIGDVIKPIINEPFYYQTIPTFRIGLPGNCFVGEYHKDSYYKHQAYEVNFNLGLANYVGEAGLRTQIEPGSEKYMTLECPYGTVFSFDHIDCLHGSEPNQTNKTMVSIDFRIAPVSLYYEAEEAASINTKSEFRPGAYFSSEVIK